MKFTHFIIIAACLALAASAHAQVVIGTNVGFNELPAPPYPAGSHFINTWATPYHSDADWHTALGYNGTRLWGFDVSVNAKVNIGVIQAGQVMNAASLQNDQVFQRLSGPTVLQSVEVGSGEFYLGIASQTPVIGSPDWNVFGWARLRPEGGKLTMIENVMVYGVDGIVVGTTQVVPEPSAWVIMVVGAAGLLIRKRVR